MTGDGARTLVRAELRDFRNYERAEFELSPALTVVCGANGAGKTNLLEAAYFGCTGRSCRTSNQRELVRFGTKVARVAVDVAAGDGEHRIEVGFEPGELRRLRVDGANVDRLADSPVRPLAAVFLPDRLELVKGAPALRRSHLDQLVAALWPARAKTAAAYGRAVGQRNALLARVRAGHASRDLLDPWDAELARIGAELMHDRAAAADLLAAPFARIAAELGLDGVLELAYRPRSRAREAEKLRRELLEQRDTDLNRGFSGHGPHRDDLGLSRDGRALRTYGSQGQQRIALLALLFAEREVLRAERGTAPLMLLDDVMSELDERRRGRLVELLADGGQALITATERAHVPADDALWLEVADGVIAAEGAAKPRLVA